MADFKLTQDQITKFTELGILDDVNKLLDQRNQATSKEYKTKLEEAEKEKAELVQQSAIQERQNLLTAVPEKNRDLVNALLDAGKTMDEVKTTHPELLVPFKPISDVINGANTVNPNDEPKVAFDRSAIVKLGQSGTNKSEDLTKIAEAIQQDPTILDEINK